MYFNITKCFAYTFLIRNRKEVGKVYQRIRDLREDRDLKQQVLADYLQCSQVCYSYYEIGRRDIPTDALIRLARFYDTSIDYLLGLTDEKKPYPRTEK